MKPELLCQWIRYYT